jgi:2-dehydro-3-deoxyphosphooctonate aldolase (KDO 8-P synthase)
MKRAVPVADIIVGEGHPLAVMCGPCVIESEDHCLKAAEELKRIFSKQKIPLIFKSSYDKANRSSVHSFRGLGLQEGLRILEKVKQEMGLPILTDIHTPEEAALAGEVCDVIQVPAFLCRQTDLLLAAGRTGKVVNVKKGQFMAPWDMGNVVKKIQSTGNSKIILVDRGTVFGYNYLINDMRGIPTMQEFGVPVCFDATHSVQLPGGKGDSTGGERKFIPTLAKAAVAAGCDCVFMEAHPDPANAKSDADSVLDFKDLPGLLTKLKQLYEIIHS